MADEQIIYLSPEEDLTGVRERLQRIEARRIILVIPAQTQLRSHVSWRLLHARARELNKEILIISSDRQIRSVVKAAGFKVADSLESSPTGRSRPGSRPSRTGLRGRTAASVRTPPGKILPGQQAGEPRLRPPYQPPRPYLNEPARDREVRKDDASEEEDTLEIAPRTPATFGVDEKQFAPGFDYRIDSSASIRPVVPSYEDEDPNQLLEDYRQAQSIRQAAANKQKNDAMMPPPENVPSSEAMPRRYDLPSTSRDAEEPFTYLEEVPPSPLPEQRASIPTASMPMHELDDSAADTAWGAGNPPDRDPDVADYPTDVLRVEDQGDQGDFVDRSGSPSGSWGMPALEEDEEQDMPGPSRVHGVRPRTNRAGQVPSPQPPSDIDDDNALPPVYDQQTRVPPPPPVRRPSGTLSPPPAERSPRQESQAELVKPSPAGNRPPQPVSLPQPRAQARTAQPPLKKRPTSGRPPSGAIARPARQPAGSQQAGKKRASRGGATVPILVVALILLLIGLLAFLVPSADVTVTLPAHSFSLPMKLTATANSRQDVVLKTLPAQTLVFNTSVTGPGHATGSTLVGTKSATGEVVFTNTGSSPIIIPTGTIIATQSGVQFATTAEADALASPNINTIPAPVQAQNPGQSGNVPADAINTIPSSSQSSIRQANSGLTAVTLSVANSAPTTGGGAGSATSVSSNDVNAEKATLDVLLQAQIKDFLKKNLSEGDQRGNLIETETPSATPAVGQVATDGTFMETLKLNMKVLVVHPADLQAAAAAQLKEALNRQKSALALLPQQGVTLTQLKNVPSKDGSSLALSFTAVGQVVPQISEDTVRNLVFGKTIDDAKRALAGPGGIPNVQDAQITVYPGLLQRLPYWQQRINVYFKATQVPAPKPKHGKS